MLSDAAMKARSELREWLDDMVALEPWADLSDDEPDPSHEAFQKAFESARERAIEAARAYVEALSAG